ncbi:MAG: LysM peptidoglycan-binding domain-containing protein [Candidatus Cryptobacteroides sp.]
MLFRQIICTAICAASLLSISIDGISQGYTQTPVTVSKDKVRGGDGKIYYSHVVQERQTLYSISKAYGVSIDEICAANPDMRLKEEGTKKGAILFIPVKENANAPVAGNEEETHSADKTAVAPAAKDEKPSDAPAAKDEKPKAQAASQEYTVHIVKWFEDIEDIADEYSVSVEDIMKFNGLKTKKLKKRQKIRIPSGPVSGPALDIDGEKPEETPEPETDRKPAKDENEDNIPFNRKSKVNALLMLPLGASAKPNENNMDFYSGALIAIEKLKKEGIDIDLSVYDVASSLPITADRLAASDFTIGPVNREQVEKVLEMAPESTGVISPLDPRTADLAGGHSNMIQAPASTAEQYKDLLKWIQEERKNGDKVFVLSEKGVAQSSGMTLMNELLQKSGLNYSQYSYAILEGREAVNSLGGLMTKTGVNRIIINSESEAFVNDAVRNLATLIFRKFEIVLYSPSKIRSFDTIDTENLHSLKTRVSSTYFVDYNSRDVSEFLLKYRALYRTEPTQFAFHGYDLTYYFIKHKSQYGRSWMESLDRDFSTNLLQTDFRFVKNADGGFTNSGIRRFIYAPDYTIVRVR